MAQNFKTEGDVLPYTNSTGATIASGAPVFIGKLKGISLGTVADGATGQMMTEGVFELPKKATLAISAGDVVFWDATPGEITKTDADGTFFGYATKAAAGSATTVEVMIIQYGGAVDAS